MPTSPITGSSHTQPSNPGGQPDQGQHRDGRVGHHMDIGGAQIMVGMMVLRVLVLVMMRWSCLCG